MAFCATKRSVALCNATLMNQLFMSVHANCSWYCSAGARVAPDEARTRTSVEPVRIPSRATAALKVPTYIFAFELVWILVHVALLQWQSFICVQVQVRCELDATSACFPRHVWVAE